MDALVTHGCSRHRNGDNSSVSSRSQGLQVLELLRGSAKLASRVKTLFVHFLKHRIADGTSTSRASKPWNVREILRGPAKMGSGEDAIFAPLQDNKSGYPGWSIT